MDVGEEICGEWLRHKKQCDFVQYGVKTLRQGEIDVLGLSVADQKVFACEVAVHTAGLQYVNTKTARPNNVAKFTQKFARDIEYVRKYFPDHDPCFMLWSPIVKKSGPTAKHNQMTDIESIVGSIRQQHHVKIETVINERFQQALTDLRIIASKETSAFESSVMRYLQIEEYLQRHLARLSKHS